MTIDFAAKKTFDSRLIDAPAAQIFSVLSDASLHPVIDGSNMVTGARGKPDRLRLGSKFSMSMKLGPLPYRITNEVVEFEQDRLIAWRHPGKHRWRYELEEVDGGTMVTETFDWSYSVAPKAIELVGYPHKHDKSIAGTLARLDDYVMKTAQPL